MLVKVPFTRGYFVVPEADLQAVNQLKRRFEKQLMLVALFAIASAGVWIFLWGFSQRECNALLMMLGAVSLKLALNLKAALLERIGHFPRQPMSFEQMLQCGAVLLAFMVLLFAHDGTEKELGRSLASLHQKCTNPHLNAKQLEICRKFGFR